MGRFVLGRSVGSIVGLAVVGLEVGAPVAGLAVVGRVVMGDTVGVWVVGPVA